MPKTEAQTMAVRIPIQIYNDLVKLRNENNLSTVGSALQYWIGQQQNEKIELELSQIRADINRLADAVVRSNKKSNILGIALQTVVERLGGKDTVILDEIRAIDKLTPVELRK